MPPCHQWQIRHLAGGVRALQSGGAVRHTEVVQRWTVLMRPATGRFGVR
jgi:hypothetical protein